VQVVPHSIDVHLAPSYDVNHDRTFVISFTIELFRVQDIHICTVGRKQFKHKVSLLNAYVLKKHLCATFAFHQDGKGRETFIVDCVNIDSFLNQYLTEVVAAAVNCVVQSIVPKVVLFETVDAALLKLIVNALQDVHASA
jgi:hypothetical protein